MRKDTVNTAFNELSVFLRHLVVTGTVPVIERTETEKAVVQNNTAIIDGSILEKTKNDTKKLIGKGMGPIHVKTTVQGIVKHNKIVER